MKRYDRIYESELLYYPDTCVRFKIDRNRKGHLESCDVIDFGSSFTVYKRDLRRTDYIDYFKGCHLVLLRTILGITNNTTLREFNDSRFKYIEEIEYDEDEMYIREFNNYIKFNPHKSLFQAHISYVRYLHNEGYMQKFDRLEVERFNLNNYLAVKFERECEKIFKQEKLRQEFEAWRKHIIQHRYKDEALFTMATTYDIEQYEKHIYALRAMINK